MLVAVVLIIALFHCLVQIFAKKLEPHAELRANSSLAEKKLVTQDAISETIILPGADRNKAIAPIKTIETLPEHDD